MGEIFEATAKYVEGSCCDDKCLTTAGKSSFLPPLSVKITSTLNINRWNIPLKIIILFKQTIGQKGGLVIVAKMHLEKGDLLGML
jgi:hypothetical protein